MNRSARLAKHLEAAVRHLGVLIPDWSEVSVQSSDWIINDIPQQSGQNLDTGWQRGDLGLHLGAESDQSLDTIELRPLISQLVNICRLRASYWSILSLTNGTSLL